MKLYRSFFKYVILLLPIIGFQSCKDDPASNPETSSKPVQKIKVPGFVADSAYQFVKDQVAFGPRVPNSEAHKNCRAWIVGKLEQYKIKVTEQPFESKGFTGTVYKGVNIIGAINPDKSRRVMLAAHWDSRFAADKDPNAANHNKPIDGADDGASGVAVLIELGRLLSTIDMNLGVDLVFFDVEDQGKDGGADEESTWCLGSQYWGQTPHVKDYKAQWGILLDMVGAKDATFFKEGYSVQEASPIVDKVWSVAAGMGYGQYFPQQRGGTITDDHYYVMKYRGFPMIDIIHTKFNGGFGAHHHTMADNINVIDPQILKSVGQVVAASVIRYYNESL